MASLKLLNLRVKALRTMTNVQCEPGHWDFDPYMHGMANGFIYCLALMEGKMDRSDPTLTGKDLYKVGMLRGEVKFLLKPRVWGKDKKKFKPKTGDGSVRAGSNGRRIDQSNR